MLRSLILREVMQNLVVELLPVKYISVDTPNGKPGLLSQPTLIMMILKVHL